MSLKERIQQDLNSALKEKSELAELRSSHASVEAAATEVSVLRLLNAAILNREKEKRYKLKEEKDTPLTDQELLEVILSEAKKRKEAIVEFEKGKREDLVAKEKQELEILQKYLPEQLSEEELQKIVKETIEKTGAKEIKDIGKVMAELVPKIKGRAEGSQISKIVKELLEK